MSSPSRERYLGGIAMPQPRSATDSSGTAGPGTPRSSSSLDRDPRTVSGVLTSPGPPNGTTSSYGPGGGSLGWQAQTGGEGSRRQSTSEDRAHSGFNSVNQSPTSQASSSRHIIHGEGDGGMRGQGGGGGGGLGQTSKLPRITTSVPDPNDDGPRSAPIAGPLRPPVLAMNGPMRSSSSPDPWTTSASASNNDRISPIDTRPPPLLGNPYPAPSLQFPTPQLPAPPRRSSHQNYQNQNQNPASSAFPPSGQNASAERQDRSLGSQSSHHSLSASNAASSDVTTNADTSSQRGKETRQGRSREPTYCGQCNQVVHGQFVRAMGKVYHLNCFRCKVSMILAVCVEICLLISGRTVTRWSRRNSSRWRMEKECTPYASETTLRG